MNIYDIIFYLFAIITLVSAFFVVTTRNIIYSAYYLLFTFFGVAGIYVLLGADFIAIVQLVVYVGGILILLLFGVMLTNKITHV
ncbi:MAG TPA: NADH-quinone oxidoreductase subunit J, partial [Ignavibacteriaceae bacterium]|nr:NADH-quinone oxidoreductase subunit J [Ignavibacteriaceae bacterium]